MFTRILYATDGSDQARKALDYTRELATLMNAEIIVVHAYASISDILGEPEHDRVLQRRLDAATDVLEEAAGALEVTGIPVVRELLEGPMAEAILRVAKVRECDLIVVGARGLSDLQGLLLGSVSHKVIQHAACPVLVVR